MSKLAKCIKVEIPTGHVLLEGDETGFYHPITSKCEDLLFDYSGDDLAIFRPSKYDSWVKLELEEGFFNSEITGYFKVIEQYGDSFPE